MQKVIAILEQHVQWIAIGLGALFVLFMTYSYVLTPPAQVKIGQSMLSPGEVDQFTVERVANPLAGELTKSSKINVPVPHYVQAFKDTMSWKDAPRINLAGGWKSPTQDVQSPATSVPDPKTGIATNPGGDPIKVDKVTELPKPPAVVWADIRMGRSLIIPPVLGAAAGQPAPPLQPGQPEPQGVDKDWVTQMFKLSMNDLAAAFAKSKLPSIPPELRQTLFLQVELVRQEQDSGGQWGPEQVVPPLPVYRTAGEVPPPFPPEGADRAMQGAYLGWASTHTPDIIQPLFHTTTPGKGDQWVKPGEQLATAIFDPATFRGELSTLPKDQRDAVMKYRQEEQRLKREAEKQKRPAAAPRGPGGRPPAGGGPQDAFAPAPPNYAPAPAVAPRPPVRPPQRGNVPPEFAGARDEEGAGIYNPGAAATPGLPVPGTDYPTGDFDPTIPTWQNKSVEIWAHDDTVVAGKTYRYKMRYKLKNPIFAAGGVANDPALSAQFALVSADSAWTGPVTIPSLVNFFVTNVNALGGNTARIEIFRWDNGQQKQATFSFSPGDQVGGSFQGVDFMTDFTIVDFRPDPRLNNEQQVLLVNNKDNSIVVRSAKADVVDPLYRNLMQQVKQAKATETAAAGGAPVVPGTPGGPPGRFQN